MTQVPAVVPGVVVTHLAGGKQGGPIDVSELQAAPSAAAAAHVPVLSAAAFTQSPPALHRASPVIGAEPSTPQV